MKFFQVYTLAVINTQMQFCHSNLTLKFLKNDGMLKSNFIFVPPEDLDLGKFELKYRNSKDSRDSSTKTKLFIHMKEMNYLGHQF